MKDLSIIEIPQEKILAVFTTDSGLDPYLEKIRAEVSSFVPDLTTKKGRAAIASIANKVATSKTALDKVGKDLVTELKQKPKLVDAERKRMRDYLDDLKIEVRKPLTDWEAEQDRIAAETSAKKAAEELRNQVESDHEIGLLLHDKFIAEKLQAEALAEQERIAHDERIRQEAREAAEAKSEQEKKRIEQERIDAVAAKQNAIETAERAERERLQAVEDTKTQSEEAERQRIAAAERAESQRIADAAQAKQSAIDAAEQAKLYQITLQKQREADELKEQACREANKRNVGAKRKAAKESLMSTGCTEELAKKIVMCIHNGDIANVSIKY